MFKKLLFIFFLISSFEIITVNSFGVNPEEFLEDPCLEEAADILEVLEAILSREKYRAVRAEQIAKRVTRGGFERRVILETVKD